ncbi:MAG: D-2-hydroxyacid dehydrogenase [Fervidicoccaceae archaeon]
MRWRVFVGLGLAQPRRALELGSRALVADPVDEDLINGLESLGFSVTYSPNITRDELLRAIEHYDLLIVRSRTKVDAEVLKRGARLKVVARAGVGLDNVDVETATRLGITVLCAPEAPAQSVAELTIGLMIAAARRLTEAIELARSGSWKKVQGFELQGKLVGIIGFGRIGSKVARILRAFEARVLVYDVADVSQKALALGAEVARSLHDLLRRSDIVSLHVPLTPETYHMIGPREFELFKDGAILVNTSRGAVIDTRALLDALNSGKIGAAALDVLENEPPREPHELELLRHPRVLVTPHIGSQTVEAQKRIAAEILSRLRALMSEERRDGDAR